MVFIAPFVGAAALLSGFVSALPRPQDSAVGDEVAVSAPNGIPLTDTAELISQSIAEAATSTAADAQVTDANFGSSNYGSSSYGSSDNSNYGNSGYGNSGYGNSNDASSSQSWATSSSSAWGSYSTPSYGSGNSNWGGSGYNDCVNQCIASYGAPAQAYTPTSTGDSSGSVGTGATHTVIVAPTQGVLRYVPFIVNASIGDTVKFMWGANNHTVTKSSALLPCNKTSDALFVSGTQNKGFTFTQVVNDTNPIYFYCATPGHCQKGMMGMINPPSNAGSPTSVGSMMSTWVSNSSDLAAYAAYANQMTAGDSQASNWGSNLDVASMPEWAHEAIATNILYTGMVMAMNKEVVKDDGSIDLSAAGSNPLMFPQDLSAALSNNAANNGAANSASASGTSTPTPSSVPAPVTGGASSIASPRLLVGAVVALVTFFAL